jgi:hypothetical protein
VGHSSARTTWGYLKSSNRIQPKDLEKKEKQVQQGSQSELCSKKIKVK